MGSVVTKCLAIAVSLCYRAEVRGFISFNVVNRHTRSTRTLAFTQASNFHKLSVPPGYIILVWCVVFKPCTKLALHCNHRSGRIKKEYTESFLLLRRHIGNWSRGPLISMKKLTTGSE
jgi:hypothetical protein